MREVESGSAAPVADELDLGAVRRALWRKKWWIVLPALVVAIIAFVGVNVVTPRYKSEARILIESRENVFLRTEAEKLGDRDRAVIDQEAVTSQVQLVLSRDLARKVIKDLKLTERPEFDPVLHGVSPIRHVLTVIGLAKDPLRMSPEERALESYYERITAFAVDKSRVIAIEFASADPELAQRAANAIAEAYLALQQTVRQDQTRVASQWLGAEIESLRRKVAEAEGKVEEFRAKSNLLVGTNNTTLSNQQLGELNSQLAIARSQKAEAESKSKLIRSMIRSGQPIESSDIINSELIRRMAEQGATLRGQLAEQSSTLLGNHPRIKELKAQIADIDRQIRAEAEKIVRSLENDSRIAGARVETLSASLEQLKSQAASTNERDVPLRALEREAKSQRDLLESYLAKYREASARDRLGAVPVEARIISRAIVSNTPYFPKKVPVVLIATLAMLLLSAGFVTTGELLAGNVYRSTAAEPLIVPSGSASAATAAYPAFSPAARWEPGIDRAARADTAPRLRADRPEPAAADFVLMPATGAAAEAMPRSNPVRDLASQLRNTGETGRRISVIGASRGVGTTSTAIALAHSLALEGRVVLVDLAFDSPSLATISTDPGAAGMADLINGSASFRHIIARDRSSRVHVIAAGQVGPDTAALRSSDRLTIAMNALSRTYDHVVVDAGELSQIPVERFAKLAPHAVLVTTGVADDTAGASRDRLLAAGFADVTLFANQPPQPDAAMATDTAAA